MFDKQYSTQEVAETLGLDIQMILWSMIDKWKREGVTVDYLQVYELSVECACGEVYQKIYHHQEIPKKNEVFYYKNIENPITAKIFIIDEDGSGVILFAHEY